MCPDIHSYSLVRHGFYLLHVRTKNDIELIPIQTWRLLFVPFPLLHLAVVMPHPCQFVSRLFVALSRCLNKQFRGLFSVAILFKSKRVKKEKKSVLFFRFSINFEIWTFTPRMPRTASLSESPQNPKQTTHHAPTRFITFSKAVHRMAVPHFGTFGVALNGLLVLKRQEKKVQGSECHRLNNTSTLTKCRLPFCWFCSQPFVHNRFEKDKKKKYKV